MTTLESLSTLFPWLYANVDNFVISIIFLILAYGFYRFSSGQIGRLSREGKLDETGASLLRRLFRWGVILAILAFTFSQLGIQIDLLAGLLVLAGGTVLGFAAMNTLGNAIAGFILMVSRPFRIGDRLYIEGQFMDVEDIDLIFTRMRTPDNVNIAIPNQKLLQTDVMDFGKERVIRRRHAITAGYGDPREKVEAALLEAAGRVEGLLDDPGPYVWITEFQNYAVEYTLFVFINEPRRVQEIDALVRREIMIACDKYQIDLSTPTLIKTIR
ncbi:mechanosensitive ion channel [Candidatus Bathyarchaeota archaeon]|nr:mechanosensitive ion channel [Candidatus Bathyarchaeota archaeon]